MEIVIFKGKSGYVITKWSDGKGVGKPAEVRAVTRDKDLFDTIKLLLWNN